MNNTIDRFGRMYIIHILLNYGLIQINLLCKSHHVLLFSLIVTIKVHNFLIFNYYIIIVISSRYDVDHRSVFVASNIIFVLICKLSKISLRNL